MRIFFHPANFGVAPNSARVITKSSLPLQAFDSIKDVETELAATTPNVGNIVHNEAVAKAFRADRRRSCMAPLERFYLKECESNLNKFQSAMRNNFDAVVLSFANMIAVPPQQRRSAQQAHMERLCEILEALPIPFYVFGMGKQDVIEDAGKLTPGMDEFLRLLHRKAKLFAVRGNHTRDFLHSMGCSSAVALGCPSLYVYPDNMLSLETPNTKPGATVLTAGYLGLRHLGGHQPERVEFLRVLAEKYKTNYTFQNDVYGYHELKAVRGFYDDATGRCDKGILDNYLTVLGVEPINFEGYWHFRDARAWRQLAEAHDFYFGDRFHGGVVALQVGKPALFMYRDLRVKELTDHIGAPNCSFESLGEKPLEEVVHAAFTSERLEQYKDTYSMRAAEFYQHCEQVGILPLAVIRTRAIAKKDRHVADWQTALASAASASIDPAVLPKKVVSALEILSRPQQDHRAAELLVRVLLDEKMFDQASNSADIILLESKANKTKLDVDFFFRLASRFRSARRWEDALKFADIFYNEYYIRKGRNTQLYASILIALNRHEEAETVLLRKEAESGFETKFAFLLARTAAATGQYTLALQRVDKARALDELNEFEDRLNVISTAAQQKLAEAG